MLASVFRSVVLAGFAVAAVAVSGVPAAAIGATASCSDGAGTAHRVCTVPLNKSLILDLPRDARDILVSNPGIADAVVRTARRIYLTGIAVGVTNLFVFDAAGDTIVSLEISVERDIAGLQEALASLIPGSNITVTILNDNVLLSGTVRTTADAGRAQQIADVFANGGANSNQAGIGSTTSAGGQTGTSSITVAGDFQSTETRSRVVNLITIEGQDQVHLKVTVAEIERNTVKQLGLSWGLENFQMGNGLVFSATPSTLFPGARGLLGQAVTNITVPDYGESPGTNVSARMSIGPSLQALESNGLVRTLAEPTLTAISGESASFLAGGEVPVPVSRDASGNVTVEYKPYGVSLAFTPVVLSDGRISMHVQTEVSEVSTLDATTSLPIFTVRRAESTLELPSGGAMVMSGLLQDNVRQVSEGLPGVRQLPVIGALFGSRDYQRNETELVIIVTPYLVRPVAPSAIARPDDGFAVPSDASATFLGQLNRQYGVQGQPELRGSYQGSYGFIIE